MCVGGSRLVGWVPVVVVVSPPLPLWLARGWAAADVVKRRSRGIGLAICSSGVKAPVYCVVVSACWGGFHCSAGICDLVINVRTLLMRKSSKGGSIKDSLNSSRLSMWRAGQ